MQIEMIDWSGGDMPVEQGERVLVRHRDGEMHIAFAGVEDDAALDWSHDGDPGDIVAYLPAPAIF